MEIFKQTSHDARLWPELKPRVCDSTTHKCPIDISPYTEKTNRWCSQWVGEEVALWLLVSSVVWSRELPIYEHLFICLANQISFFLYFFSLCIPPTPILIFQVRDRAHKTTVPNNLCWSEIFSMVSLIKYFCLDLVLRKLPVDSAIVPFTLYSHVTTASSFPTSIHQNLASVLTIVLLISLKKYRFALGNLVFSFHFTLLLWNI